LSNGEKKEFLERIKLFIRLVFSPELMREVAADMQQEYDDSRRHAALQQKSHSRQNHSDLNHCES